MCLVNTPSGKWPLKEARHFMVDFRNEVMIQKRRRRGTKD